MSQDVRDAELLLFLANPAPAVGTASSERADKVADGESAAGDRGLLSLYHKGLGIAQDLPPAKRKIGGFSELRAQDPLSQLALSMAMEAFHERKVVLLPSSEQGEPYYKPPPDGAGLHGLGFAGADRIRGRRKRKR